MKKSIISYRNARESNLVPTSQRVIEKMENNPVFPNPPAALEELKKALADFQDALVKAQGRDKEMVSVKNDKKAVVIALLSDLSEYVTLTSKGDKTSILSSGFDVTEERSTTPAPSTKHCRLNWDYQAKPPHGPKKLWVPKPLFTSMLPKRRDQIQYGSMKAVLNAVMCSKD